MVTSFNWDVGWDIRRHDRLRAWSRVVTAGCGLILDRNWGSRNSHLMDREAARGRRRRAELFPQYRHFFRDDGRDRALDGGRQEVQPLRPSGRDYDPDRLPPRLAGVRALRSAMVAARAGHRSPTRPQGEERLAECPPHAGRRDTRAAAAAART